MIRLDTLEGDKGMQQDRKRVGRGESSGLGKTSGRGHKGAGARSGAKKGKGFEGGQTRLARRLPKRGFTNAPFAVDTTTVSLGQLARFEEGAKVDRSAMVEAGLVSKNAGRVKVLANGILEKKLEVEAEAFSAGAREKIEAAGGTCTALESPKQEQ